ncbi:hypothetical protein ES288_D07G174300v1 [Gossypium darwinii]|uniref:Uncharacterized protein ycf68 n=1 Tax=Gossypium darwinii TaxID=34276 RepID=A0A5D2C0Y2_GOSDA|nr:hypothetical protein ES288_D07G174300v1 [Gossypium darwinii]
MCYNRWDKGSRSREGFETKLLLRRIDGAIQVRSNVDPTFYSLHLIMYLYRLRTTRSPLLFWGDGGIIPFEPFFHTFPRGLEKATINRIFLILPSQKEEREILFPFLRDQEIGSSRKKNAWLIHNSLLGL